MGRWLYLYDLHTKTGLLLWIPQTLDLVAKRRYSYGNPITRRGVAVSIEKTVSSALPFLVTTTTKVQSSNQSHSLSSGASSYKHISNLSGSQAQNAGSKYYCSSRNLERTVRRTLRESYDYSQYAILNLPDQDNTHSRSNRCIKGEKGSRTKNIHTNNGTWSENKQNIPFKLLRKRTFSKTTVAKNSPAESHSSIFNKIKDVEYCSWTPEKYHGERTTGIRIQKLLPTESHQNDRIQIGINRFQRREEDFSEPVLVLGGRSENDSFDNRNNYFWEDINSDEKDNTFELIQRYSRNDNENETWYEQSRQETILESKSNTTNQDTLSGHRLNHITDECTPIRAFHPLSHHTDPRMLKRMRQYRFVWTRTDHPVPDVP